MVCGGSGRARIFLSDPGMKKGFFFFSFTLPLVTRTRYVNQSRLTTSIIVEKAYVPCVELGGDSG